MDDSTTNPVTSESVDGMETADTGTTTPKPVAKVHSPYLLFGFIAGFMPRLNHLSGFEFALLVVMLVIAFGQSQRYYAVLSAPRRRGFFRVLFFAIVVSIALAVLGANL